MSHRQKSMGGADWIHEHDAGRLDPAQTGPCCAPLTGGVLTTADAEQLAQAFKALGDPSRVKLLSVDRGRRRRRGLRLRPARLSRACPSPPCPTT